MGTVGVKIRVSEGVWKIMRAWAWIFSTDGCFLDLSQYAVQNAPWADEQRRCQLGRAANLER